MKHLLMCLIWLALSEPSCAKARTDYLPVDSIHVMTAEESDTLNTPAKKKSLITRFLDYFNDANKNKKHKKFDFSIIGGPHYSTDTKLGLGLVAAGLYRTNPNDTILPPSNVSLFGDVSTVGFYMLGIRVPTFFHRISTVPTIPSISTPFPATTGAWDTTWEMTTVTRVR